MSSLPRPLGSPLKTRTSTKQQIQDIALQLFTEIGYQDTSVEDVARSAGISPRTTYRYFGTKEQLVVWDPIDERIVENLQEILSEHADAHGFLSAVATGYAELARRTLSPDDAERLAVRMRLVRDVPDLRTGEVQQMDRLAQTLAGALLASPLATGHAPVRLRLAAYQLTWSLLGLTDEWVENQFDRPFQEVLDHSLPLIIEAVSVTLTADA